MKDHGDKHLNRPFRNLATLLRHQKITPALEKKAAEKAVSPAPPPSTRDEKDLFLNAMADVTPLTINRRRTKIVPRPLLRPIIHESEDQAVTKALHRLIRHGDGFLVAQTPEYMESANPGAGYEVLRRLHAGHYAIQDHVDLHHYSVAEAKPTLDRFIRRSIERGHRAVLVVHGRGLTSPGKPVLKGKVLEWLTRGPLRKWVIALTSARGCDGGAGATYVLLRHRPMTKSQRKKIRPSN